MIELKQDDRPLQMTSPFGSDAVAESFSGEEMVNGLFHFDIEVLSRKDDLDPAAVLLKPIDIKVRTADDDWRFFNGIVKSFRYSGGDDRVHYYHMEIVPWFWQLTKSMNCKVHESAGGKSVKEIVSGVFDESGFTDYEWNLRGTPPNRDYCLQYRETDFEFVSRLLAEEGIFYFFTHEEGKHTLHLVDSAADCSDCPESEVRLNFLLSTTDSLDHLASWQHIREVTTSEFKLTDYDFEDPQATENFLTEEQTVVETMSSAGSTVYDHSSSSAAVKPNSALLKTRVQNRIEAEEADHETLFSSSDRRTFYAGGKFTVTEHFAKAEAGTNWLLLNVQHRAHSGGYLAGAGAISGVYSNTFRAIPSDKNPRPRYARTKPMIHGIQSAVVVGPSGDEIHTDEYGRVRIQFHWDLEGGKDESSSCWVRTVTPWAGTNWGMIAIPRIGQEVVVNFLNGDIDSPVVMGMLYNKDNMPPYALDDNKTQSGIKTHSTVGGGDDNFNELRFEDKINEEEVYLHAERDFNCVIENNETREVGYEKSEEGNQEVKIYNNQELTVGVGNSNGGSQTIKIGKDRTVTLNTGDDSLTISQGNQKTKVSLGKIETEAMQSIELKVGSNSIKIDQTGITLKGVMVKIKGDAMVEASAPMTNVKADGILVVKGGMTMIN
ncbi:type VI secretion system tip protein TssI/VgrG [Thalassoglobus sp. JC818]|uniref:type VI secretion system Vgr family protein n=1 Tax=Thalassoglobus sp. JC818 TaxID=3232136 RepID=UPI003458BC27